ncbi:putative yir2 protein [Plasmodium yoelii yoelii]|uniref:Yir2 protein n=1 Tax=Plasmodium yoelii yoelii TaxID=73239 RepID=Q7RHA7_PLAYO|nr:putative yir2 protein [Plasmodium yoelii yoelii]
MKDDICGNFDYLRKHLSDELNVNAEFGLEQISDYSNYCPNGDCNTELEKITIGFLWLLGKYFTEYPNKGNTINSAKPFFLYIILWLSYKLNQNSDKKPTNIYDFYTENVIGNNKYSKFIEDSNKFTNIKGFIDKQKDFMNINIKDLSKLYDAFKLLCSMHDNGAMSKDSNILLNSANEFVSKYQELCEDSNNTDGSSYKQILSALSTDYNNLKNKHSSNTPLPDITADMSAYISRVTSSSSSTGNKLFTILSIFGAIAFFLGISYKVNNKELKNYFHYIYVNVNKKIIRFITFYISIRYLDFGNDFKNKN